MQPLLATNPLSTLFDWAQIWVIDRPSRRPVDLLGVGERWACSSRLAIAFFDRICRLLLFKRDAPTLAESL